MDDTVRPSGGAVGIALLLVAAALVFVALVDLGEGFAPRVMTIDAVGGLAIGAFLVDRLLTFVPPFFARDRAEQRTADLSVLRLGYGAVLGALFVSLTDLRAVAALTSDPVTVSAAVDRGVAVLAIAGGAAGLARILSGVNPQPETKGDKPKNAGRTADDPTIPPPSDLARGLGIVGLVIAVAFALFLPSDDSGLELLGLDKQADGTLALLVRFGTVLVAAAIVQQLTELPAALAPKHDKPLVSGAVAVVLGVLAARVMDLYLLHNIGFFGASEAPVNDAIAASTDLEVCGDAFLTGVAIAAGAKPLHDLAARLRKTST